MIICMTSECPLARLIFDQLLSWVLGKKPVVQIGLGSPKTKFQSYRPINDTLPSIFVFWSIIIIKEHLAELKFAIFNNWLDTRTKIVVAVLDLNQIILWFKAIHPAKLSSGKGWRPRGSINLCKHNTNLSQLIHFVQIFKVWKFEEIYLANWKNQICDLIKYILLWEGVASSWPNKFM